jgi:hypothetical protein
MRTDLQFSDAIGAYLVLVPKTVVVPGSTYRELLRRLERHRGDALLQLVRLVQTSVWSPDGATVRVEQRALGFAQYALRLSPETMPQPVRRPRRRRRPPTNERRAIRLRD